MARCGSTAYCTGARPALVSLGERRAFDITPWADRVQLIDAKYAGTGTLPAIGAVMLLPPSWFGPTDTWLGWRPTQEDLGLVYFRADPPRLTTSQAGGSDCRAGTPASSINALTLRSRRNLLEIFVDFGEMLSRKALAKCREVDLGVCRERRPEDFGEWCGRRDLNPHGPCGPTDFRTRLRLSPPPPLAQGLGSGLSLHRARIWLRVSGAARLVSTPSRPFRAGLGSGSPFYRVPRL